MFDSCDSVQARVGAVIVTFRRKDMLLRTIQCVLEQTVVPDFIVVVDNAADPMVRAAVLSQAPDAVYLESPGNSGFAGGLAAGMQILRRDVSPDFYWLLDDDSPPASNALAVALDAYRSAVSDGPPVGVVANRGGHVIRGRIRHGLAEVKGDDVRSADFTLVDGAIISAEAVEAVGVPRPDLFMMLEDVEYTTRIRLAGYRLLVRPNASSVFLHLGSSADWRGYYQARNHIRIALDLGLRSWLWGWFVRESAIALALARRRRFRALRYRWSGAVDGLRNRMGKTVDPDIAD